MADLAVLRTAKQALQEELISQSDYDQIKTAYTKAQMIKAGLDAGFIREEDYVQARNSFLQALDFQVQQHHSPAAAAAHAPLSTFVSAPQPHRPAAAQGGGGQLAAAQHAATLPRNGSGPSLSTLAPSAAATAAAPAARAAAPPPPPGPPPPAAPAAAMMMMAAAARAPSGAGAGGGAPPQSTSGELPGTIPIPTNLNRIGRAGIADGKKSMSGIALSDVCVNLFNHIKTRSSFKWLSYKIDDAGAEVVVDQLGAPDSSYEQFLATLPSQQCRYAVYDYAYSNQDTGQVNQKLVFIHWAPTSSSTKAKMMYASTKEFLKGFLDGIGAELQADTLDELSEGELVNKIASSMARK